MQGRVWLMMLSLMLATPAFADPPAGVIELPAGVPKARPNDAGGGAIETTAGASGANESGAEPLASGARNGPPGTNPHHRAKGPTTRASSRRIRAVARRQGPEFAGDRS
jgi:hypothetical protein